MFWEGNFASVGRRTTTHTAELKYQSVALYIDGAVTHLLVVAKHS